MKGLRTPGRASSSGPSSGLPTPARSRSSSTVAERSKTPTAMPAPATSTSTRPPSRSSVAFTPILDAPVRIASLGFEGILRYLGPIPPKPGIWAGVELLGGFAGKGKNDGSTPDGKRYFQCEPMCGVFVAVGKLSRATVGVTGVSRPPSVASNTSASETMSGLLSASTSSSTGTSGRITPAGRTGRLSLAASTNSTSYSGRMTPGNNTSTGYSFGPETPAARAGRLRNLNAGITPIPLAKSRSQGANTEKAVPVPAVPSIPRSSSAAGHGTSYSIPSSLPSPTAKRIPSSSSSTSSSIHQLSSPFTTPKQKPGAAVRTSAASSGAGIGLGSPHGTPRPRIPSGVAMPPPPSPSLGSSPEKGNDASGVVKDLSDLQKTTRDLQERIRGLTGTAAGASPPSPSSTSSMNTSPPSAFSSTASTSSYPTTSPTRRPRSRIASVGPALRTASRARSRSRASTVTNSISSTHPTNSHSTTNSISSISHSRPSSVASTASVMSASTKGYAPRSSTPGFGSSVGPRSSTPGFSAGPRSSTPGFGRSISRASGVGVGDTLVDERLERMQSRIAALEYENQRLRDEKANLPLTGTGEAVEDESLSTSADLEDELGCTTSPIDRLRSSRPSSPSKTITQPTSQTPSSPSKSQLPASSQTETELKLKQQINLLTLRLDDASSKALSSHARAETLQVSLAEVQAKDTEKRKEIEDFHSQLDSLTSQLDLKEETLSNLQAKLQSAEEASADSQASLETLQASFTSAQAHHAINLEQERSRWEEERKELRREVDELRKAGQETIELYEDKLEEIRRELSSGSNDLRMSTSSSSSSLSRSRSSTLNDELEKKANEDAHAAADATSEELSYLSQKVTSLTDALAHSQHLHQSDLSLLQTQLNTQSQTHRTQLKSLTGEYEERFRGLEGDVGRLEREVEEERRRRGEIEEALRESGEALEEARGELEGMRMGGLGTDSSAESVPPHPEAESTPAVDVDVDVLQATLTLTKSDLKSAKEEIAGLKHLVKELQMLQRDSERDGDGEIRENLVLREENRMLQEELEALRDEIKVLEDGLNLSVGGVDDGRSLEEKEEDVKVKSQRQRRETAVVNGSGSGSLQITLLNGTADQHGAGTINPGAEEMEELRKEIETLKKKISEMEVKAARKTHDLNKEISELEALVEAKIYREDELEQEIERLNEKVRKVKQRSGKSSAGPGADTSFGSSPVHTAHVPSFALGHASSSTSSAASANPNGRTGKSSGGAATANGLAASPSPSEGPLCEICDRPGHDIFSCDLLREDYGHVAGARRDYDEDDDDTVSFKKDLNPPPSSTVGTGEAEEELDVWCEECEGHGHRADECPYAGDVF